MDLSDDESNMKKTKNKTDPIQLQVNKNNYLLLFYTYLKTFIF